jgi:hypothetical protein
MHAAGVTTERTHPDVLDDLLAAIRVNDVAKYTVSEVRQRIGKPLAYARGSDQSRDGHGAVASKYDAVFMNGVLN